MLRFDPFDLVHFLGCTVIVFVAAAVGCGRWWAGFIAIACGFVWECLDEINKRLHVRLALFDSAGFSWGDILCDILGATFGCILLEFVCR